MSVLEDWGIAYLTFVKKLDRRAYRFFRRPQLYLQNAFIYFYNRLIPLPWMLYIKRFRVSEFFLLFHGWVPSVELPSRKV